jgi:hypothetical protein
MDFTGLSVLALLLGVRTSENWRVLPFVLVLKYSGGLRWPNALMTEGESGSVENVGYFGIEITVPAHSKLLMTSCF